MENKTYLRISFLNVTLICIFLSSGCKKEVKNDNPIIKGQIPVLTTLNVTAISPSTAWCGGNISYDGGSEIISRGLCWSTNQIPTINDEKTLNGSGKGNFSVIIEGLVPATKYYIAAYATNTYGTAYGNIVSFTTMSGKGTLTDIEGNIYNTIIIGTQTWMAENLKTIQYSNGDIIETTDPSTLDIHGYINPKFQWTYDGNENNAAIYGRLYTWYAVDDNRNICPNGWHVPDDNEWNVLTTYLGGDQVAGDKMKETSTTHWVAPNSQATNASGFTALPAGHRDFEGSFEHLGIHGVWWSATGYSSNIAFMRQLYSSYGNLFSDKSNKMEAYSVRCIKD